MESNYMPKTILVALDMMRNSFGGTQIKIIGEKLRRLEPTEYAKGGKIGVDIEIEGIKVFFGYQEAEDILSYGQHIADELVFLVIKNAYPNRLKPQ